MGRADVVNHVIALDYQWRPSPRHDALYVAGVEDMAACIFDSLFWWAL